MQKEEKKKLSKIEKIVKAIGYILFGILFAFSVALLVISTIAKNKTDFKVFGYAYSIVVSPSMEPTINVYDIIIIKGTPYEELENRDIIVFYNPEEGKYISHRIKYEASDGFVTQGDNNEFEDSFHVTKEAYTGEVVKYGRFLGIGELLTYKRNYIFMILICAFLCLFVSEVFSFIKNTKGMKAKEEETMKQELIEAYKEELRKKELESQNEK